MTPEGGGRAGLGAVLALALAAAALSVVHPVLLMFVPLSLMLLALPPRSFPLLAVGTVVLITAMVGPRSGMFWYAERGWALLLGAWFIAAVVLLPQASFVSRGIAAVGASVLSVVLLFLGNRAGWERLDSTVETRLAEATAQMTEVWSQGEAGMSEQFATALKQTAELQARLYPSLLALASLAALAVGWWAYRRIAAREARPLRPLKEFRFVDELVWLFIAGIALLVLPLGDAGRWTGYNVVAFMAVLYALRGTAVLLVLMSGKGPAAAIIGGLALIFLYPVVMAATLVLGLTDTWLDLRARRPTAADPGS